MTDPVAAIAEDARARHARWNAGTWQAIVEGPGRRLAESLPARGAEPVLRSWLQLSAEGVGLGLLALPVSTVLARLWLEVLPQQLAALPERDRLGTLAQAWNLGEAVEGQPGWVRALVLRLCATARLRDLAQLVDDVQGRALEAPPRTLDGTVRVAWVPLSSEEPRFLPGRIHFVAPAICCVHARAVEGLTGLGALGVWLAEEPVILGRTGCREEVPAAALDHRLTKAATEADPRLQEIHAAASNAWRGAVALETSQFLVALLPAA